MRSASILAFSGLAVASYIPPQYEVPAEPQTTPAYEAPVDVESTAYSTIYATITSCAPDVECPASSTVTSSSVVPLTTSTIYETRVHTVESCPPEVEDCPATSGGVIEITETIAVSTTICPVDEATETPYPPPTGGEHVPTYDAPSPPEESAPASSEAEKPSQPPVEPEHPEEPTAVYPPPQSTHEEEIPVVTKPAEEPLCPTESVKTITYSTEITTVVPTVLTKYETATIDVPCQPEETHASASIPAPPVYTPPVAPPGNGTTPGQPIPSGPAEAGAAGISGSIFVAAFAAVAAFVFA